MPGLGRAASALAELRAPPFLPLSSRRLGRRWRLQALVVAVSQLLFVGSASDKLGHLSGSTATPPHLCAPASPCTLFLPEFFDLAEDAQLRAVEPTCACDGFGGVAEGFEEPAIFQLGGQFHFSYAVPSEPGLWRLCLCRDNCDGPEAYNETVGELLVPGVQSVAGQCTSGDPAPCVLDVAGLSLAVGDAASISEVDSSSQNCSDPNDGELAYTVTYVTGYGAIVPECNTTSCAPGASVIAEFTMFGVDFAILSSNLTLLADFQAEVVEAVLAASPAGIAGEHIQVALASASVSVEATITPPSSVTAGDVESSLLAQETAMLSGLVDSVLAIPGVSIALSGAVSTSALDVRISLAVPISASSTTIPAVQTASLPPTPAVQAEFGSTTVTTTRDVSISLGAEDAAGSGMPTNDTDATFMLDFNASNASFAIETTAPFPAEYVRIVMTVNGVNYTTIASNGTMLLAFETMISQAILTVTPAGITASHVAPIILSTGSVFVQATVFPPSGISASSVETAIIAQETTLAAEVVSGVSSIPGIDDAIYDSLSVTGIDVAASPFGSTTLSSTAVFAIPMCTPTDDRSPLFRSQTTLAFSFYRLRGGDWRVCYFLRAVGDVPTGLDFFLQVPGPATFAVLNNESIPFEPYVSKPFDVEVAAPYGGLTSDQRLVVVHGSGAPSACDGATWGPEHILASPDGPGVAGSTGVYNTSLQWMDVLVGKAGEHCVFWCAAYAGSCSDHEEFTVLLGTFLVQGPAVARATFASPWAGQYFNLTLQGFGLADHNRIRITQDIDEYPCGALTSNVNALQLRGPLAMTPDLAGAGNSSTRAWLDFHVMEKGAYPICWCRGDSGCDSGADFYYHLATLVIQGPIPEDIYCNIKQECILTLSGFVPYGYQSQVLIRKGGTCELPEKALRVEGLVNPQSARVAAVSAFSRFRFIPLEMRRGNIVQMNELYLYFNHSKVDLRLAVASPLPGASNPYLETPQRAFDGSVFTKFLDFNGIGLEIVFPEPIKVDGLSYQTGNDRPERDPVAFLFEASNDGVLWRLLSSVLDANPPDERYMETAVFPCKEDGVNGTDYMMGYPVGSQLGVYPICWGYSLFFEDFPITAGTLTLAGLSGLQDRECILGEPCTLGPLSGVGLAPVDRVAAINTTGQCTSTGGFLVDPAFTNRESWAGPWEVAASPYPVVELPAYVPPRGGTWRLCYCFGTGPTADCSDEGAGFSSELGILTVFGIDVRGAFDFECEPAKECVLGPLFGPGLSSNDRLMLLLEDGPCGGTPEGNCSMPPEPGNVSADELGQDWNDSGSLSVRRLGIGDARMLPDVLDAYIFASEIDEFGSATFTLPEANNITTWAARWNLYYCVDPYATGRCDDFSGFTQLLGQLTIIGPDVPQNFMCTLGIHCAVTITGLGFWQTNSILLAEEEYVCGRAPPTSAFGGLTVEPERARFNTDYTTFDFEMPLTGRVGPGVIRLCWAITWTLYEHFQTEIGVLSIVGPEQNLRYTCFLGTDCILDIPGYLLGDGSEVWAIGLEGRIQSEWMTPTPFRCNTATATDAAPIQGWVNPVLATDPGEYRTVYRLGIGIIGPVGDWYTICWRHSIGETYIVEVGKLDVRGPRPTTQTACVLGLPCSLALSGYGLVPTNGVALILGPDCTGRGPLPDESPANQTNATEEEPMNATSSLATAGTTTAAASDAYVVENTTAASTTTVPITTITTTTTTTTTSGYAVPAIVIAATPVVPYELTEPLYFPPEIYEFGVPTEGSLTESYSICWATNASLPPGGPLIFSGTFYFTGPITSHVFNCDLGDECSPVFYGTTSPYWREYWITTGADQHMPYQSLFLGSCGTFAWLPNGTGSTQTWKLEPAAREVNSFWIITGDIQNCPGQVLYLNEDCEPASKNWTTDPATAWTFVPVDESLGLEDTMHWLVSVSDSACPMKMLVMERILVRVHDFFRSPWALWGLRSRVSVPWPHRSSLVFAQQGAGCGADVAPEQREGLVNPVTCCRRTGYDRSLDLNFNLGIPTGGPGIFDICWGFSSGEAMAGRPPRPADDHFLLVGTFFLRGPNFFGDQQCSLGLPCGFTLSGLSLAQEDSIAMHPGEDCTWPELPTLNSPVQCASDGSDGHVSSEVSADERVFVATTCAGRVIGVAGSQAMVRRFSVPAQPRLGPEAAPFPLPEGPVGVALDGLAIFGPDPDSALYDMDACGVSVTYSGQAYYVGAPGIVEGRLCDAFSAVSHQVSHETMFGLAIEGHAPLLGFMADGIALFGPWSDGAFDNTSDFDECSGHASDLPFYHYHATGRAPTDPVIPCLRGIAFDSTGFSQIPATTWGIPSSEAAAVSVGDLSWFLSSWELGNRSALLVHARSTTRYYPSDVMLNDSEAVYELGLLPDKAGYYTVCWGRTWTFEEHRVPVVNMELRGPHDDAFTCTLGVPCTATLHGVGLNTSNYVKLTRGDGCDDPLHTESEPTPTDGLAVVSEQSFGTLSADDVDATYAICWSAEVGSLLIKVGPLSLYGPKLDDQFFICTLARDCEVFLDERVLDPGVRPLLEASADPSCGRSGQVVLASEGSTRSVSAVRKYEFGFIATRVHAEILTLCWQYPADDSVTVFPGTIVVRGPHGMDVEAYGWQSPVAMEPLAIQLDGAGLSPTDEIRIVPQHVACGTPLAAQFSVLLRAPEDEVSSTESFSSTSPATSQQSTTTSPGSTAYMVPSTVSTTSPVPTLAGAETALDANMSANMSEISSSDALISTPVDAMSTTVPTASTSTSGIGLSSTIQLVSTTVSTVTPDESSSTAPIASTTEVRPDAFLNASTDPNFSTTDMPVLLAEREVDSNYTTNVTYGNFTFILGGNFRVCWCSQPCAVGDDFNMSLGPLSVRGPEAVFTIPRGHTGVPFALTLRGVSLSEGDRVRVVLDGTTCRDGHAETATEVFVGPLAEDPNTEPAMSLVNPQLDVFDEEWINTTIVRQGTYHICWCPAGASCVSSSDFLVHAGQLNITGVSSSSGIAGNGEGPVMVFSGIMSVIQIVGSGLDAFDFLKIVPATDSACMEPIDSSLLVGEMASGATNPFRIGTTGEGSTSRIWGVVAMFPVRFRICWCAAGGDEDPVPLCDSTYVWLDMGEFDAYGPLEATTIGASLPELPPDIAVATAYFDVEVSGNLLAESVQVELVPAPYGCGDAPRIMLEPSESTKEATAHRWHGLTTHISAELRVCARQRACNAEPCHALHNPGFGEYIDLGTFLIVGPYKYSPSQQIIAGVSFFLELSGRGFTAEDKLRIIWASYNCDSDEPSLVSPKLVHVTPLSANNSDANMSASWLVEALPGGGFYQVCWCSGLAPCENATDFRLDAGQFEASGPVPMGHIICPRDIDCTFNITGFGISPALLEGNGSIPVVTLQQPACGYEEGAEASLQGAPGMLQAIWPLIPLVVGTYEVCWTPEVNATTLTIGEVTVLGPYINRFWTCVSGRVCAITDVTGVLLEQEDKVVVREASCNQYDFDLGEGRLFEGNSDPKAILSRSFAEPVVARYIRIYPTKWFGNITLRAAPIVMACEGCPAATAADVSDALRSASSLAVNNEPYCSTCGLLGSSFSWIPAASEVGEWYQIDVGGVTAVDGVAIAGGNDIPQWVEEFMVSYSIDGIEWTRLRDAISVPGFAGGIAVSTLVAGVEQFVWPAAIDAKGGQYRLCWCRAAGECRTRWLFDYVTPLGEILVHGPITGESWTCMVGEPCAITGVPGVGLQRGDSIKPLIHCSLGNPDAPVAYAWDDGGTSQSFDWGISAARIEPRKYRLCWCRPLGQESEELTLTTTTLVNDTDPHDSQDEIAVIDAPCHQKGVFVDAGQLIVAGPRQNFYRCYAGQYCTVKPVDGEDLYNGDRMMVTHFGATCGSDALRTPVPGIPDRGVSAAAIAEGSAFQWPSAPFSAPGGDYTLCWCRGSMEPCGRPRDFDIPVGTLRIVGPYAGQARTCLGGLPCILYDIQGVELEFGDEIAVRTLCPNIVPPDPEDNITNVTLDVILLEEESTSTTPEILPDVANDSNTTAMEIATEAPITTTETTTQPPVGQMAGFPDYAMQDASGNYQWPAGVGNTAPGGVYRLCWRPAGFDGDFGADAGPVLVLGPRPGQERFAAASLPLEIPKFEGAYGETDDGTASAVGDRVMVADACASEADSRPTGGIPSGGISGKYSPSAESYSWGSVLVSTIGGSYRLCWCSGHNQDGTPRVCDGMEDFAVDIGSIFLDGPRGGQTWRCSASRFCVAEGMVGSGFGERDRIMVKNGECSAGIPLIGLHWTASPSYISPDRRLVNFDWGPSPVGAQGGYFRVCYCTERDANPDADPCTWDYPHRFATDAGTMIVRGPKPVHAPWAIQFGGPGNDTTTGMALDTTEKEKGLQHTVLAGNTLDTIENPYQARLIAESQGMKWDEGRSKSDYIEVPCCHTRYNYKKDNFCYMCAYLRLSYQPLKFESYGGQDGWVAKVAYNGSRLWVRQLGSLGPAGDDSFAGVSVSKGTDSMIAIAGTTDGNWIPDAPLGDHVPLRIVPIAMNGGTDGFVVKLTQWGEWAGTAQIGSRGDDFISGVGIDKYGSIFVAFTRSEECLDRPNQGGLDAMVVKFNSDMELVYAGLLGSEGDDVLYTLIMYEEKDGEEKPLVAGYTTDALFGPRKGAEDIMVALYTGEGVVDNRERKGQYGQASTEIPLSLAQGADGSIYIGGYTNGNLNFTFADTDARFTDDNPKPGGWDGFVMKINKNFEWQWTQMPGTVKNEYVWAIAFLGGGNNPRTDGDILAGGSTFVRWPELDSTVSPNAPTHEPGEPEWLGHEDTFLVTYDPMGNKGSWEKQLQSPGDDRVGAMAGDPRGGHVYVAGHTIGGGGFTPEVGSTQLTEYGASDIWLIKLAWARYSGSCFIGAACEADLSDGVDFELGDQALIARGRCAPGTVNADGIPDMPSDGMALPEDDDTGVRQRFQWGNKSEGRIMASDVGRFVMCWCAEGCEGAVPLEVSVINVAGPTSGQARICVTGEYCDVTGMVGRDLSAWDKLAVMAPNCTHEFVPGLPRGSITEGMVLFESENLTDTECSMVVAEEMPGVVSNWGCERVVAAAGSYRMCWCSPRAGGGECREAVEFSFDLGELILEGPLTGQDRRCIRGWDCHLFNFKGVGLKDDDKLLVLENCRQPQPSPARGAAAIRGVEGISANISASAYNFGTEYFMPFNPVTALPGTYSMCWCRPSVSARGCTNTDDYAQELGKLTVAAPNLEQLRRCVRGMPCRVLDLEGESLGDGDRVHILNFCPLYKIVPDNEYFPDETAPGSYVIGWPQDGLSTDAWNEGRSVSWSWLPVWSEPGRYALCWCMGSAMSGDVKSFRCDLPQDFFQRIGDIMLAGPDKNQIFRAVAGHPVVLEGISGYGFTARDQMAVLPADGNCTEDSGILPSPVSVPLAEAATTGFPEEGLLSALVPPWPPTGDPTFGGMSSSFTWGMGRAVVNQGGIFKLCMLIAELDGSSPAALALDPVPLETGVLQFDGPIGAEYFMRLAAEQLAIGPVQGTGLLPGDILLAATGGPCGSEGITAVADLGGEGISYITADGTQFLFPGAANAPGGLYTLCWCRPADFTPCRRASDFFIDVGTLGLNGPLLQQANSCSSGFSCTVTFEWPGQGIVPEAGYVKILVIGSCGGETAEGAPDDAILGTTVFTWEPLAATGGDFPLCWCSPRGCASVIEFAHHVGSLAVVGPYSRHLFECQVRSECVINPVGGVGLEDGFLVLFTSLEDNCPGRSNYTGDFSANSSEFAVISQPATRCVSAVYGCTGTWTEQDTMVSPGLYRMCWCPSTALCSSPRDFFVDIGALELLDTDEGEVIPDDDTSPWPRRRRLPHQRGNDWRIE